MSSLTDDADVEALASGAAKRRSDLALGFGLDPEDDDLDLRPGAEAEASSPESTSPKSPPALGNSLQEQIDDYNEFLSNRIGVVPPYGGAGDDARSSDSWDDHSGHRNRNLASIPEDNSTHGSAWPDYPGLYDYADDNKDIPYSYRYSFWIYRGRFVILITGCTVALLAFVLLLAGKKKHPVDIPGAVSAHHQNNIMWYDRSSGWKGETYADAEHFCSMIGRELCSYKSICPQGKGAPPVEGIRDGPKGSWAPVSDGADKWVQVGRTDTCELYNDSLPWTQTVHEGKLEEITRHLACCIVLPSVGTTDGYPSDIIDRPPSLEEDDKSNFNPGKNTLHNYRPEPAWEAEYEEKEALIDESSHPKWFGVSDGWSGTSYDDAANFCEQYPGGYVCPYEAYCPGGPGLPPFKGMQGTGSEELWAPLWNEQALWVGVGSVNTCLQSGVLEKPNEAKVRFILCCIDEADALREVEGQLPASSGKPDSPSDPLVLTAGEQAVLKKMDPGWYGRKDGYMGTSHTEAQKFCEGLGDGDRTLCMPEAYCPNKSAKHGDANPQPLYLRMAAFEHEQWAPVISSSNTWLLIGKIDGKPDTTCELYEQFHDGQQPIWGLDGTLPELKKHVMCCLKPPTT